MCAGDRGKQKSRGRVRSVPGCYRSWRKWYRGGRTARVRRCAAPHGPRRLVDEAVSGGSRWGPRCEDVRRSGGARGAGRGAVTGEGGSSLGEVGLSRDFSGHGPAEGAENCYREGHPEVLRRGRSEGRGCSRPTAAVQLVGCHVWGVWHRRESQAFDMSHREDSSC